MEGFITDYNNKDEFRELERALKKYNMLAFRKLHFEYYPSLRRGKFLGDLIDSNEEEHTETYELKLPSDLLFTQVHGEIKVEYKVLYNEKRIILITIKPKDVLLDGHVAELNRYKGVMNSKRDGEIDDFMINLFSVSSDDKK